MSELTVITHLRAIDGQIKETKAFLTGLIDPTHQDAGCIEYWLHRDNEDPAEFTFYETGSAERLGISTWKCRTFRRLRTSKIKFLNFRNSV